MYLLSFCTTKTVLVIHIRPPNFVEMRCHFDILSILSFRRLALKMPVNAPFLDLENLTS